MFRFTIRDVLWLTLVVGLTLGWWFNRRENLAEMDRVRATLALEERKNQTLQAKNSWQQQLIPPPMLRGESFKLKQMIAEIDPNDLSNELRSAIQETAAKEATARAELERATRMVETIDDQIERSKVRP